MCKSNIAVFSKGGILIKNISRKMIYDADGTHRCVRYKGELHHVYNNRDSPVGEHILPVIIEGDVLTI